LKRRIWTKARSSEEVSWQQQQKSLSKLWMLQSKAKQTPFIKEENIGKSQLDYHKSLLSVLRNSVLNKRKILKIRTFKTCFLSKDKVFLKRLKQSSDFLSNSRLKSNKDFSKGASQIINDINSTFLVTFSMF